MKNKILIIMGLVVTTALVGCIDKNNTLTSVTYNCADTVRTFNNSSVGGMTATIIDNNSANCKIKFTCPTGYYMLPAAATLAVGGAITLATYTGDGLLIAYRGVSATPGVSTTWLSTNSYFYENNSDGTNTFATCIPNQ